MLYDLAYEHVLTRIPPERAHNRAAHSLRLATASPRVRTALRRTTFPAGDTIAVDALGRRFPSPIGVSAGLDKDATWFEALGAVGFGSVEIGTVTPRAQPGRAKPRIARITADRALVNAMGFPNDGADAVARRLAARSGATIVGANIGKNLDTPLDRAADDYRAVAARLAPHADYVALNVSSPNTPGLRTLETAAALEPLVAAVQQELAGVTPAAPLLVKISPDLPDADVDAVADLAVRIGLGGVIATNTTVDRGCLSDAGRAQAAALQGGGLSGAPLGPRSRAVLARLHRRLRGTGVIVVSAGGIGDGADVWERLLAGATLVQAYTGFIYGGPAWPRRVNRELAARVRAAGAESIGELIGSAAPPATLDG